MIQCKRTTLHVLLLFVTLGAILLFFAPSLVRQLKEGFENQIPKLSGPLFREAYKLNGIEKCAALQFPSITASNMIETGRLRQWKPTGRHPKIKDATSDGEHAYCYYYLDDDKQILQGTDAENSAVLAPVYDPMLVGACSTDPASDSLWSKFTGVIKDAFVDKEADANHKLPYKKCVLKVALSNEPEKEKMWKYVEDQNLVCKGALDAVQKEYNTYVARLAKLQQENDAYRKDYGTREELGVNLRTCVAQSNELAENLIPSMHKATQQLQQRIINDRSQLDTAIQQIKTSQAQTDQSWEKVVSDIVLNTRMRDTLQQSISKLTEDSAKMNTQRVKCRQQHKALVDEAAKRSDIVEDLKQKYNVLESHYNKCKQELDRTNAEIGSMSKEQVTLKEKNKNLTIQLEGCLKEKVTATYEESAWRKKADELREKYESCSKVRATEQAKYDGFVAKADALTLEIEEIKKRCRTVENEFHKANLETARDQAETTIESTRTYCANVAAMKAKKAALMDELCELNARLKAKAAEPQPCGDENRKTTCCPYKVKPGAVVGVSYTCCGGFNFEAPDRLRLRTSEATVNRVRDAFPTAGSYIGIEGMPTKVYKLHSTKRDKGGEDWIKFSPVHPNLGTLHEIIALKRNLVVVTNPPPDPYTPPGPPSSDPPVGQGDRFC